VSTQSDYTIEEWNLIVSGPVVAGSTIVVADPAIFGSIKESAAMAKAIAEYGQSSEVELIQAIGAAVRGGHKPQTPDVPKDQGTEGAMKALIAECRRAVKVVLEKSPDEAEAYAHYLLDIAEVTAESSKEGGFLGIGSTRVSEQEKAALQHLADGLNIEAPSGNDDDDAAESE
jgi:hypothetical protein